MSARATCKEGSLDMAHAAHTRRGHCPQVVGHPGTKLHVSPVLTAHPTEVQRKSILDGERAIAQLLAAREHLLPRELADNEAQIRARVMQLWQTRLLRFTKLTVADEIENALSYYEATFLRQIPRSCTASWKQLLGTPQTPLCTAFLRMGQWIGGDRDGNPNRHCTDTEICAQAPVRSGAAPPADRSAPAGQASCRCQKC
jgi:phosphoenolpyruvate carboxylase